ncbi:MAG: SDR family oxidoreductase, partial [Candidatus Micrarchaeota archaeon]|nr:SDR family oxidoreductase [Candidatus Micrarchaeota archaeon]
EEYEAVDVVIPSTDTIVKREKDIITEIPDRDQLMLGQTPQGFRYNVIKNAYELFEKNPVKVSDDCGLVVKYSLGRVGIVIGERFNIKITYPEDIYLADKILQLKSIEISDSFVEHDKLKEKVVVIFGGNSGIGKEIGKQAEKKGANVFLFSRSNGCNVANPEHVSNVLKSVYEKVGKIDFVVNTAAILNFGPIIHRTYESIAEEIMTNYYGNIVVAKESFCYLRLFVKRWGGYSECPPFQFYQPNI